MKLVRGFAALESPKVRRAVVALVASLAPRRPS
jgi:hypothetical protein